MPKRKKLNKPESNEQWREWSEELGKWQQADLDQRQDARDADRFLLDKDGQWEDSIRRQLDSQQRPRYTFDKITPVIESMMADFENMDIGINIKPAGNGADKDVALTLEGMIRQIQNHSRSDKVFRDATRRVMRRGFDAWMIKADYADDWSFEQDLFIKKIPNAINRVWVSPTCVEEDSSDTPAAYVLSSMSPADYKKEFPNGSGISVDDSDIDEHYDEYTPEVVTIAERYYRKEHEVEIAQLSNGNVVEVNDDFKKIQDEMAQSGVRVSRTKKIKGLKWYHCTFDGGGILTEERETVFRSCPIITVYGNYENLGQNNKITYSGIVMKEMDAQRVHNYAKSREIEEGALAPRAKWWMTKKQVQGHENQIARMNISADPVQFYNHDDKAPPPYYAGGAQINPHLSQIGNQMAVDIKEQANVFSAMQGDFAGRMSEDTVKMQIDRGTASTRKWINPIINGVRRTAEVLLEAMPVVYDTKRQFMLLNIDGTEDQVMINEEVYDNQTQQMVKVNDLNKGKYSVVADAGPAFANKLEAGLNSLLEYAALDPSIVQQGGDIMLKSIDAPLVDKIAERKRAMMIQQGMIPVEQMTQEETAKMQQQAANAQPDPAQQAVLMEGQARMMEGQAAIQNEVNDANKIQIDAFKAETDRQKVQIQAVEAGVKIEKTQAETDGVKLDNAKKLFEPIQTRQ